MASMTGPPEIDPALVRAAQRGDPIAVAELMDALAPYVGRVCGPIALQDGPDAAQEALIAILRNLGGLREPGAIYGWARAIAGSSSAGWPPSPRPAAPGSPSSAVSASRGCGYSIRFCAQPSGSSPCALSGGWSTGSGTADWTGTQPFKILVLARRDACEQADDGEDHTATMPTRLAAQARSSNPPRPEPVTRAPQTPDLRPRASGSPTAGAGSASRPGQAAEQFFLNENAVFADASRQAGSRG
jgi:hypothetical protein